MRDPYCYPDTDILRNRLGITDEGKLRVAEADYVSLNLAELAREDAERTFDFKELCRMHYRIFRDIFEWAGKPRVINIEKMEAPLGNISIEYSDVFDIERDAQAVLKGMNLYNWKQASFDETVENFSGYMAALWKVHPFREGNTRTVVTPDTRGMHWWQQALFSLTLATGASPNTFTGLSGMRWKGEKRQKRMRYAG